MRSSRRIKLVFIIFALFSIAAFSACGSGDDDDSESADDTGSDDTAADDTQDDASDDTSNEPDLLEKFQPILVQKLSADYSGLPYPESNDRIGSLSLHEGDADSDYIVQVDTNDPVMYSFERTAVIRGNEFRQLVYEFFYRERRMPTTFFEDPVAWLLHWWDEAPIDGKVVRITLGEDGETPLLVEVSQSCGCGWQFFVNKIVDDQARAEFEAAGEDYPGLAKADAPHDVEYVHIMPEDLPDASPRVTVMDEDGWGDSSHDILGAFTSFEQWEDSDLYVDRAVAYRPDLTAADIGYGALEEDVYALLDYDPLYTLAVEETGEEIGVYDQYGYIWNAYGAYCRFLRDVLHKTEFPGTPRDPLLHEVVHEHYDYWEQEALYDLFIYLPHSLFGEP